MMKPVLNIEIPSAKIAYSLRDGERVSLGRKSKDGADIQIDDPSNILSRKHMEITFKDGRIFVMDTDSANGILHNRALIAKAVAVEIRPEDQIELGGGYQVRFQIEGQLAPERKKKPQESKVNINKQFLKLINDKSRIRIGRGPDNDIIINDLTVSREHAEICFENGQYWVKDLDSKNGVFVDDEEVEGKAPIKEGSTVFICLHSLNLVQGYRDLRKEMAIRATEVEKKFANGNVGLKKMNVEIPYSEFVAVMGPSGCGKSTLIKVLNGDNPASSGQVFVHGLDLIRHYNLLKKKIGYVPQDDIIHKELTVRQTMTYAARLRLPADISINEINQKIESILDSLFDRDKIKKLYDKPVKKLSGGERKRLSIAVELLTEPSVLFLDEPTSPLDPESIDDFLNKLIKLKDKGTTIIMVTHKPEDLNYVDNVIFLGAEGQNVYYGSKEGILNYFGKQNIIQVYNLLSQADTARSFYLRLYNNVQSRVPIQSREALRKERKEDSYLHQFFWLAARYLSVKLNDRENVILLLAQPVIIAGLISLIFKEFQVGVLFLMAMSAIWFGVSNAAKEIVGEQAIYKRERMFNLNIHTYIFSKWMVLSGIALVQAFVFVSIIYIRFRNDTLAGFEEIYLRNFSGTLFFVFFLSVSATLLGLLLSARFNTTEKVMTIVPIALMPQIMLAGVITRIDNWVVEFLSFLTFGRWGTEGLARIQDAHFADRLQDGEQLASVITFSPTMVPDTSALMQNCQCMIPDPKSTQPIAKSALDILNFYDDGLIEKGKLIGGAMNDLSANNLAIFGLNLIFYVSIYIILRRKDSIQQ